VTTKVSPVAGSVNWTGSRSSRLASRSKRRLGLPSEKAQFGAAGVAQPEELLQGRVGALGAAQPGRERQGAGLVAAAGGPRHRVEDPVHDQGPDLAGEQVGVGGAQVGTVGVAGVGQLGVADGPAQQVHVAGHVGGRHVVEDRAAALGAGPGDGPVGPDPDPFLLPGERERDRPHVGDGVVEGLIAAQRRWRTGRPRSLRLRRRSSPSAAWARPRSGCRGRRVRAGAGRRWDVPNLPCSGDTTKFRANWGLTGTGWSG
jgi:hypothetical protein